MLLDRCPWYIVGPILGLGVVMIGLRATVNSPLGAAGVTLQRMLAARKNVAPHMPAPAAIGL